MIPNPINEPVFSYAPGTPERVELKRTLKELSAHVLEIPVVVGGSEIRSGKTVDAVMPHCHRHVLAKVHQAGPEELEAAVAAAREAWREWSTWSLERRAAVFLKAADLLATRHRAVVNAATMLGQSKTAHQAEIDAACELVDFWRFNVHYAERLYAEQPISSAGMWNQLEYRPLEGFVYAITPFNFTSIGGNLPTAPAIMGCTVVWKPAATAASSNYHLLKLLEEAGLPPGVVNFVPGPAADVSARVLADRHFGGIHFTGSTEVFQGLWRQVASHLGDYADYPRLVGETGGKDFIVAHASADVEALATAIVRGAYGYQGQKCSAASRAYGPVLTLYPYPENQWRETLQLVDRTSPYALTGAVFAQDRGAVTEALTALRYAAGNFYINDKPTGAVVGQQPFGGARASGTNDKAGSILNLLRWVSPRAVKENFVPPKSCTYPFMAEQ